MSRHRLKAFLWKHGLVPARVIDRWWEQSMIAYFDRLRVEGKCVDCGGEGFLYGPYEAGELIKSLSQPEEEQPTHPCSSCAGTGRAQ